VIINRFGKRERDGKGLSRVIERALDADIPVVIAVSSERFADWIKFAGGMSVKLACDPTALGQWWNNISMRASEGVGKDGQTVCDFK
jgi:ABC-type sugar transport system substrate-binding protein